MSPRERVDEIVRLIDEVLGDQTIPPAGVFGAHPAAANAVSSRRRPLAPWTVTVGFLAQEDRF